MSDAPRITLVGKPGCHLCDDARVVIERVCAETGEQYAEISIYDDLDMADLYWEQIPVTLVDGVQHDFWRVDADRLRAALAAPRPQ
ncbi:MAG: glutaredoxin family protein [Candidatus Nanopelagicales bacterium]